MSAIPGGDALHRLVFAVLDNSMATLIAGEVLEPALIEETGVGDSTITRFTASTLESGVGAARRAAERSRAERVAVRWDGTVEAGGEEHAALYVLAQERGQAQAHTFIQRHTPVGAQVSLVGKPGYLGERGSLF